VVQLFVTLQNIINYFVSDDSLAVCPAASYKKDCDDDVASILPLVLIFLSQFVLGIGSTLYYALGQPYLDDNVKKTKTPMLLGSNRSNHKLHDTPTRYGRYLWRSQNIVGFCRFRMFITVSTKARQLDLMWASRIQPPLPQPFLSLLRIFHLPFLPFILLALYFIPSFLALIFLSFLTFPQSQRSICSSFWSDQQDVAHKKF
jgi:hypothetical protein